MIRAAVVLPASVSALSESLASAGVADGTVTDGLVYGPPEDSPATWEGVEEALVACFRLTREAAVAGARVVYLVSEPALLGRTTPEAGMLAAALLSGARAYAMERRRDGGAANVLAYDGGTDPDVLARWTRAMLELNGPSGALMHLGADHHGKVRQ